MGTKPVLGLAGIVLAGGLFCGCCDRGCRLGNNSGPPAVAPPSPATAQAGAQQQQQQRLDWNNPSRNVVAGQQAGMTDPSLQRAGFTQPAAQAAQSGPQTGLPRLGTNAFDQGQGTSSPPAPTQPGSDTGAFRTPTQAPTDSLMKQSSLTPGSDPALQQQAQPAAVGGAGVGAPQNPTPAAFPPVTQSRYQTMQPSQDQSPFPPAPVAGQPSVQQLPRDLHSQAD
jgi:hypothetical protein